MKFKLTSETKVWCGITFYRIEATESFGNVKKGDKGGFIQKEENLSQEGDAWVFGDAWVYGNARVYGDAQVFGDAWVYGDAQVFGDARVYGDAQVYGDAWVFGNAWVFGDAQIFGKLKLTAGLFFGVKWSGEKVQEIEIENGNYLIGKGDIKFGEEEKTETIEIGGIKYDKNEVEKALKNIKAFN